MKHDWENSPFNGGKYLRCDGFTISYLATAVIEGCGPPPAGETALINHGNTREETVYLILDGDWCKEYDEIVDLGYQACRDFYESKKAEFRSRWSEDETITDMTAAEAFSILSHAARQVR